MFLFNFCNGSLHYSALWDCHFYVLSRSNSRAQSWELRLDNSYSGGQDDMPLYRFFFFPLFTERSMLIFLSSWRDYKASVVVKEQLHMNGHWSSTQKASYRREILQQQTKMFFLLLYWFSESFRLAEGVWLSRCPTFCSPWWGIVPVRCHLRDLLNPIITAEGLHGTGTHSNKVFALPPKHQEDEPEPTAHFTSRIIESLTRYFVYWQSVLTSSTAHP